MSTNVLRAKDIKRNWELIDAKGKVLGRLATEVATKLMGKNGQGPSASQSKPSWVPYLDSGNYIVIINAKDIKITGKKADQKKYVRHSGFPGGLKVENYYRVMKNKPDEIIRHAVRGMLPKTKLGRQMIKKLHVFASSEHHFKKQVGGVTA